MGFGFDGGPAFSCQQWELMFSSFQHSDVGMQMGINMSQAEAELCAPAVHKVALSAMEPGGVHTLLHPLSSTVQINTQ